MNIQKEKETSNKNDNTIRAIALGGYVAFLFIFKLIMGTSFHDIWDRINRHIKPNK